MVSICVITDEGKKNLSAEKGENLYEVLIREEIAIDASCGGHEVCAKCQVRILEGIIPEATEVELSKLGEKKCAEGIRLACSLQISADMLIQPIVKRGEAQIQVSGVESALKCDDEVGYAIGIDIGTTTVAAFLMDLSSGKTIATSSSLNAQRPYGGDVISRCGVAIASESGKNTLSKLICDQLSQLISELLDDAKINAENIRRVTLAGNPTMMHLAAKLDVNGIAVAPYKPFYTEGFYLSAEELPIKSLNPQTPVLFMPVISGYVGADTVAAVIASQMDKSDELTLLIDIGTNGEIVLGRRDKLLCCAAAAGPAFEGGKISCGIGGIHGAVDKLFESYESYTQKVENPQAKPKEYDGGPYFTTIAHKAAKGICGSGLIDLIALLLKKGCIDETGLLSPDDCDDPSYVACFDDNGDFLLTDESMGAESKVSLTQKDVREVQLAKSAIASGIDILALRWGVKLEEIERVYLAGGFGSYIDYDSACALGLLPGVLRSKIIGIGNAAGLGARMTACSDEERKRAEDVAKRMEYIELAEAKEFSDEFMDNMLFPVE